LSGKEEKKKNLWGKKKTISMDRGKTEKPLWRQNKGLLQIPKKNLSERRGKEGAQLTEEKN